MRSRIALVVALGGPGRPLTSTTSAAPSARPRAARARTPARSGPRRRAGGSAPRRARRCTGSRPLSGSSSSSSSGRVPSACASFDPLPHALREAADARAPRRPRARRRRAPRGRAGGSATPRRPAQQLDQLAGAEEGQQRRRVGHDPDAPVAPRVCAADRGRARARCPGSDLAKPAQSSERGRLARAVVAEQAGDAGLAARRDLRPGPPCRRTTSTDACDDQRQARPSCSAITGACGRDGHDDAAGRPTTTSRRAPGSELLPPG